MSIIIGQEAITPDGLGRIVSVVREKHPTPLRSYANINVRLYATEICVNWPEHQVELISPRK